MNKCQCPEKGIQQLPDGAYWPDELPVLNHAPMECLGTRDLKEYRRAGKSIYLCSTCCISEDTPVDGILSYPPPEAVEIIFEFQLRQALNYMIADGLISIKDEPIH